jgi:hypothetical protein
VWLPWLSEINKTLPSDLNFRKCFNQSRYGPGLRVAKPGGTAARVFVLPFLPEDGR